MRYRPIMAFANEIDAKKYKAKWYAANRERIRIKRAAEHAANYQRWKEAKRRYRVVNKEKIAAKRAEHYKANKQRIREAHRAYYVANRDRCLRRNEKWAMEHPGRKLAITRDWCKANIERVAANKSRYAKANKSRIKLIKRRYEKTKKGQLFYRDRNRHRIAGLHDIYIKQKIKRQLPRGVRNIDIPSALIDAKRLHLKVHRLIKEKRK
jgi:hypothetical protein